MTSYFSTSVVDLAIFTSPDLLNPLVYATVESNLPYIKLSSCSYVKGFCLVMKDFSQRCLLLLFLSLSFLFACFVHGGL